jgi:hypothetical protein
MATVNKDFRVKHGLVVEGTNATVDGSDIITEAAITGGTQTNITVTYDAETKLVSFEAENGVADSNTDDLTEGSTNQYFTDARAKTSAADLLTGATLENITITGDGEGLTITAENGVADSTTDDLDEGTTNKYFTDQRALDATASAYDVAGAAAAAQEAAEDYADGLAVNYDAAGSAATAEQNAIAHADALVQGLDVKESVVTASTANFDITTNASGGIGGSALANGDRVLLKNQTNIAENGIYVYSTATQTIVASTDPADTDLEQGAYVLVEKGTNAATGWIVTNTSGGGDTWTQFSAANEYTAGTGITIDANSISVTADTYDAYGAAADAEQNAKDYADETFVTLENLPGQLDDYVLLTEKGEADGVATLDSGAQVPLTQLENVTDVIDALTTDDIAEGANLYFTDTRAVDALEAVVPNFTSIEVNSIAKQVAAIAYAASEGVPVVAFAFAKADYRSAKFLVKVAYSTHTEVSEVLLTLDTSDNVAITEFAVVSTNGSASLISANIDGSNVQLIVTANNDDSTVTVFGTLLSEDLLLS